MEQDKKYPWIKSGNNDLSSEDSVNSLMECVYAGPEYFEEKQPSVEFVYTEQGEIKPKEPDKNEKTD